MGIIPIAIGIPLLTVYPVLHKPYFLLVDGLSLSLPHPNPDNDISNIYIYMYIYIYQNDIIP